jgi:NO-binding membrane sensor protein with MHYT domain
VILKALSGKDKAPEIGVLVNDMLYLNTFHPISVASNTQNGIRVVFTAANLWNSNNLTGKDGLWDRIAVLISGLCLVHCISTMVFVALLSSVGGMFLNPLIHEIGIGIAIALGMFTLGRGVIDHGYIMPAAIGGLGLGMMMGAITLGHDGNHGGAEVLYTMLGVGVLALGHDLNYRATH